MFLGDAYWRFRDEVPPLWQLTFKRLRGERQRREENLYKEGIWAFAVQFFKLCRVGIFLRYF